MFLFSFYKLLNGKMQCLWVKSIDDTLLMHKRDRSNCILSVLQENSNTPTLPQEKAVSNP